MVRERVVHVAQLRARHHQLLGAHAPRQLQELGLLRYYLVESALSKIIGGVEKITSSTYKILKIDPEYQPVRCRV